MTTTSDLVTHNGKSYRLADLAHYMDHWQREEVHSQAVTETAQEFWAEFTRRFPLDADYLTQIVPVRNEEAV